MGRKRCSGQCRPFAQGLANGVVWFVADNPEFSGPWDIPFYSDWIRQHRLPSEADIQCMKILRLRPSRTAAHSSELISDRTR